MGVGPRSHFLVFHGGGKGGLLIQRHKVTNLGALLPYLSPCPLGPDLAAHLPGLGILHLGLLLSPLLV